MALVAAWLLWPRTPRLADLSSHPVPWLFRLPGVVAVKHTGPKYPARRVVHVLDYHAVPDDPARADGLDPTELAEVVDRVQE